VFPIQRLFECEGAVVHVAGYLRADARAGHAPADAARQLGVFLKDHRRRLVLAIQLGVPGAVEVLRADFGR